MSETPTRDRGEPHPVSVKGRPHGKWSSWMLVAVVILAFLVGGAAMIMHLWLVFLVCLGIAVLSVPTGMLIHIMDDTVGWTLPLRSRYQAPGSTTQEARKLQKERNREDNP